MRVEAPSGNLLAILALLVGTALFTVVDVLMKLTTAHLPVGEAIVLRNIFATLLIAGYAFAKGGLTLPSNPPWRLLGWRVLGEGGSTITFLSALAVLPIADVAGIGQFTPLAITAAAALFLGEPVGWRRWLATFAGLLGVMLIIRPGMPERASLGPEAPRHSLADDDDLRTVGVVAIGEQPSCDERDAQGGKQVRADFAEVRQQELVPLGGRAVLNLEGGLDTAVIDRQDMGRAGETTPGNDSTRGKRSRQKPRIWSGELYFQSGRARGAMSTPCGSKPRETGSAARSS